jgi:hypothetical protein
MATIAGGSILIAAMAGDEFTTDRGERYRLADRPLSARGTTTRSRAIA